MVKGPETDLLEHPWTKLVHPITEVHFITRSAYLPILENSSCWAVPNMAAVMQWTYFEAIANRICNVLLRQQSRAQGQVFVSRQFSGVFQVLVATSLSLRVCASPQINPVNHSESLSWRLFGKIQPPPSRHQELTTVQYPSFFLNHAR